MIPQFFIEKKQTNVMNTTGKLLNMSTTSYVHLPPCQSLAANAMHAYKASSKKLSVHFHFFEKKHFHITSEV